MKIEANSNCAGDDQKPIGLLNWAVLCDAAGLNFSLHVIEWAQMRKLRQRETTLDLIGFPVYVALDQKNRLHWYPAADKDYEIKVGFYPPMEEQ